MDYERSGIGNSVGTQRRLNGLLDSAKKLPEEMSMLEYKHGLNLGESTGQHTGSLSFVMRIVAIGGLPWSAAALVGLIMGFGRKDSDLARSFGGAFIGDEAAATTDLNGDTDTVDDVLRYFRF